MTQPVLPEEVAAWQAHVGRTETLYDVLSIETLRRFAVACGADPDVERGPPPLGHWAFFLEARNGAGLGTDGHPRRGGFLPAIHLPRRMFAAASLRFPAPLVLGAPGALIMTVAEIRHRPGKAGDLVFVEVDRSLVQDGVERVSERQTIIYRGAGAPVPPVTPAPLRERRGAEPWCPGPVELFRFSAVTFNAHRIHYDLPYAQAEEGYPALVVHGPLTAAKLCALAARSEPGRAMAHFSFRAAAPIFAGQTVLLAPAAAPGAVEAVRCDNVIAMTAQAGFSQESSR